MKKKSKSLGHFCCVPDMVVTLSGKKVAMKVLAQIWDRRHKKLTPKKRA